jgi:hypothetical protein
LAGRRWGGCGEGAFRQGGEVLLCHSATLRGCALPGRGWVGGEGPTLVGIVGAVAEVDNDAGEGAAGAGIRFELLDEPLEHGFRDPVAEVSGTAGDQACRADRLPVRTMPTIWRRFAADRVAPADPQCGVVPGLSVPDPGWI